MPYKNKEDKRKQSREWQARYMVEHREEYLAKARAARKRRLALNPDAVRAAKRASYQRNRESIIARRKPYFDGRKAIKSAYDKAYRLKHRERINALVREWHHSNKERLNEYCRNKRANDPQFAIRNNLRCRVNTALRNVGLKRDKHIEDLIGCTIEFLMGYLEAKFTDGMSWENRGKWHIDHIMPCASFDLTKSEQRSLCFHYTNLQPLWAVDNIVKSDNIQLTN